MASAAAQVLSKDVVSDIITGPRGTPFMLDTSRIFSPILEEKTKPVYVSIEGKRFYGRDPVSLVQTLPDIINATQPAGFARAPPPTSDAISFTAAEQEKQVSSAENNARRKRNLNRSVNKTRNYNRMLQEKRERVRKEREELGKSLYGTTRNIGRGLGTAATYGARGVGTAATYGARGVGTAATYGAKGLRATASGVGTAATYGAKGLRGLFSRSSNKEEPRPGSVAAAAANSTANNAVNTTKKANNTNQQTKGSFLSMFTRKAKTPRPGSVAAAAAVEPKPPANNNKKAANTIAPINTGSVQAQATA